MENRTEILRKIKPSKIEEAILKIKINRFLGRLNKNLEGTEAILGGSVAKDTHLRGTSDVDIFVLYEKDKDISNKLEKSLKIDAKRLLKSIRPYGGDLLDIGCSFGFLLEVARELGFKVFGADISQDCINYCISKGFIVKSLSDYNDNFFDIITLIGVIDHFSDPIKDFQEIKRVSKPGASIIIRIANMDLFLGRHSTVKPPEHLYYFSSATLKRFLEDNGFQVTNIRRSLTPFTIDEFSFRVFRYLFRISHYDFWFDIQKLISGILKFLKMDKIVILFPDGQIILNARCKK